MPVALHRCLHCVPKYLEWKGLNTHVIEITLQQVDFKKWRNISKSTSQYQGAQWLSGRVLYSRPRGRGFEPHWRHCVMSLSKSINPSLVLVQPRKIRSFMTERLSNAYYILYPRTVRVGRKNFYFLQVMVQTSRPQCLKLSFSRVCANDL